MVTLSFSEFSVLVGAVDPSHKIKEEFKEEEMVLRIQFALSIYT